MAVKVFIDTNVLLDYILRREGELEAVETIMNIGFRGKMEMYISESVITTSFFVLGKTKMNALNIFRDFCHWMNVLKFDKHMLYMPLEKFPDPEDGLLYYLALHHKMDFFITRNIKHFTSQLPSLPALTPKQFLKFYNF